MLIKILIHRKKSLLLQKLVFIFVAGIFITGCGKVAKMNSKDVYVKQVKTCLDKTNNADECKE